MSIKTFFKFSFFFCMVAIFFLATTSLKYSGKGFNGIDKVNHAFAFFVLYLLMDHGFQKEIKIKFQILILLGIGTLIECIQYFLPLREFSLADIMADGLGILWYILLAPYIKKYISQKAWQPIKEKSNR